MLSARVQYIIAKFTVLSLKDKAMLYNEHVKELIECIYDLERQLKQYKENYSSLNELSSFKEAFEQIRIIVDSTSPTIPCVPDEAILEEGMSKENDLEENSLNKNYDSSIQEKPLGFNTTYEESIGEAVRTQKDISKFNSACCGDKCPYLNSIVDSSGYKHYCRTNKTNVKLKDSNFGVLRCRACWRNEIE